MTIDEIAKELVSVRTEMKMLKQREKELVATLYNEVFNKDSYEKEQKVTDKFVLEKFPALSGDRYNLDEVRKLAMSTHRKLMTSTIKYKADEKALQELVNDKLLTQDELDGMKILINKIKINVR